MLIEQQIELWYLWLIDSFPKFQSPNLRITNPGTVEYNTVLLNPEKKTTVSPKLCLNFHYVCNFMEPTLLDGAHE